MSSDRATLDRPASHKSCRCRGGGERRWAGGGPGSVHFLQRPEGELQSSPSWPFHHPSDTDRLHHPHSLTYPHQHSSSPPLASPYSPSSLTRSSPSLFMLLFSSPCVFLLSFVLFFCCTLSILPSILQVLIKSVTSDSPVMPELCFPLYNPFFTLPFFSLLALWFRRLSPGIIQEVSIHSAVSPYLGRIFGTFSLLYRHHLIFHTFLSLSPPFLLLAPKTRPRSRSS